MVVEGADELTFRALEEDVRRTFTDNSRVEDKMWAMKEAKDRENEDYDPNHQKYVHERDQICLSLWEVHLKSPKGRLGESVGMPGTE